VDSFHTDFGIPRLGPCNVTVDGAGYTFVTSCGVVGQSHPLTASGCGGTNGTPCPYRPILVYDRAHHLVGAWPESHFAMAPRFGPNGEIFTVADDGSILKLKVSLPDA